MTLRTYAYMQEAVEGDVQAAQVMRQRVLRIHADQLVLLSACMLVRLAIQQPWGMNPHAGVLSG